MCLRKSFIEMKIHLLFEIFCNKNFLRNFFLHAVNDQLFFSVHKKYTFIFLLTHARTKVGIQEKAEKSELYV